MQNSIRNIIETKQKINFNLQQRIKQQLLERDAGLSDAIGYTKKSEKE